MRSTLLAFLLLGFSVPLSQGQENKSTSSIALEALNRLKGMDIEANPAIKNAVLKILETTRGTPQFVEIVRDFKIQGKTLDLIAFAAAKSDTSAGVDAVKLVLESGETNAIVSNLTPGLVRSLGNSAEKRAVPLLAPLLVAADRDVAREAVRALVQTQEGAKILLAAGKEDKLPAGLRLLASSELNAVRWPEIKEAAAKAVPLPPSNNAEPLPPIAELVKRKGDALRGASIFASPMVGCTNCHQVRGAGMDFGPNLSEIGTKLGKDALYESILDPSAGISFGFEAWQIELKNGDELFGLIPSETADEVTVKNQTGIVTKVKKADIAKRQKMTTSIMPAGLQQTMTTQEFVDLVEYLAALKKQ